MRSRSFAFPIFPARLTLPIMLCCLCLAILLAGCNTNATSGQPSATPTHTATIAPTATATMVPQSVTSYSCAAGSLPVNQGYIQTSCNITSLGNYHLLQASYTGKIGNYFVDESHLKADRWHLIDEIHGDSPAGAIGNTIYTGAGAWFDFQYDYPTGIYSIKQGVPINPQAASSCGQTLKVGTKQRLGIPLPANGLTTDDNFYTIVPTCISDLEQFYAVALQAAGWTLTQPFQSESDTQPPLVAFMAIVTRGTTNQSIWLEGDGANPTILMVTSV